MSTKISLNDVACYKTLATPESGKKVNLIYGLNGSGKSTSFDFLYDKSKTCFLNYSVEGRSNTRSSS